MGKANKQIMIDKNFYSYSAFWDIFAPDVENKPVFMLVLVCFFSAKSHPTAAIGPNGGVPPGLTEPETDLPSTQIHARKCTTAPQIDGYSLS